MFFVGLTGGIATGKSTVSDIFKEHGVAVIDADQVAREVMEKDATVLLRLREEFGEEIFTAEGSINRPMLANIVFNDTQKRKKLNGITHPKIQRALLSSAIGYFVRGHMYVVMELPLLFETKKMCRFMHKIVTVICEDHQQLDRLCKRNNLCTDNAITRINAQMPLAEKIAKSDFVIDNSCNFRHTREQTELILAKLEKNKYTWCIMNATKFVVGPFFITLTVVYICSELISNFLM